MTDDDSDEGPRINVRQPVSDAEPSPLLRQRIEGRLRVLSRPTAIRLLTVAAAAAAVAAMALGVIVVHLGSTSPSEQRAGGPRPTSPTLVQAAPAASATTSSVPQAAPTTPGTPGGSSQSSNLAATGPHHAAQLTAVGLLLVSLGTLMTLTAAERRDRRELATRL
jgi:hypothetical protein